MHRRMGYAEKEGEAAIRRKRKQQRRKELIIIGIITGLVVAFVSWAYWMFITGQTPIWK